MSVPGVLAGPAAFLGFGSGSYGAYGAAAVDENGNPVPLNGEINAEGMDIPAAAGLMNLLSSQLIPLDQAGGSSNDAESPSNSATDFGGYVDGSYPYVPPSEEQVVIPIPVDPAQEEEIHGRVSAEYTLLCQEYNFLVKNYNATIQMLNDGHNRPGSGLPGFDRYGYDVRGVQYSDFVNSIPENSKWRDTAMAVYHLRSNIGNASAFYNRIIGFDPDTVRSELSSRLTSDGRVAYLVDFEQKASKIAL